MVGTLIAKVITLALVLGFLLVGTPAASEGDPGPWMVFTSTRTGNGDLYTLSVSSGVTTQLSFSSKREDQAAWSWDGSAIAYRRGGDIWTMNPDGSGQTDRTPGTASRETFPFWLPDGRLGFTSDRSGNEELYLWGTPEWTALGLQGRKAAAAPDGEYVCYTRDLEVYWARLDGSGEFNVSQWAGSDHDCVWKPTDSSLMLIHSHRPYDGHRTGRIWLVNRGGVFSSPPVTEGSDNTEGDNSPTWHTSGWIGWSRHLNCTPNPKCGQQPEKMELFAMSPDGQVVRLTSNNVEDSQPDFRP